MQTSIPRLEPAPEINALPFILHPSKNHALLKTKVLIRVLWSEATQEPKVFI